MSITLISVIVAALCLFSREGVSGKHRDTAAAKLDEHNEWNVCYELGLLFWTPEDTTIMDPRQNLKKTKSIGEVDPPLINTYLTFTSNIH